MSTRDKLKKTAKRAKAINQRADPVIDSWITIVTKRLTDSPYTGPILLAGVVIAGVIGIVVLF